MNVTAILVNFQKNGCKYLIFYIVSSGGGGGGGEDDKIHAIIEFTFCVKEKKRRVGCLALYKPL